MLNKEIMRQIKATGKVAYLVEDTAQCIKRIERNLNVVQYEACEHIKTQLVERKLMNSNSILVPIWSLFTPGDTRDFAVKAAEVRNSLVVYDPSNVFWEDGHVRMIRIQRTGEEVSEKVLAEYATPDSVVITTDRNIPVRLPVGTGVLYTPQVREAYKRQGININTNAVFRDDNGLYINGWCTPKFLRAEYLLTYEQYGEAIDESLGYIKTQDDIPADILKELEHLHDKRMHGIDCADPLMQIPITAENDLQYGLDAVRRIWDIDRARDWNEKYDLGFEFIHIQGKTSIPTYQQHVRTDLKLEDLKSTIKLEKAWDEFIKKVPEALELRYDLDTVTCPSCAETHRRSSECPFCGAAEEETVIVKDINPDWVDDKEF